jgi:hypothetical protein
MGVGKGGGWVFWEKVLAELVDVLRCTCELVHP